MENHDRHRPEGTCHKKDHIISSYEIKKILFGCGRNRHMFFFDLFLSLIQESGY